MLRAAPLGRSAWKRFRVCSGSLHFIFVLQRRQRLRFFPMQVAARHSS